MRKLSCQPKNPKHFVAMCFIELRGNPELRGEHQLMRLVCEYKGLALFKCAYGFFWVNKNQKVLSSHFHESKKVAMGLIL